jgi:hypothetical protein
MPKLFSSAGSGPNALSYKGLWTTDTFISNYGQSAEMTFTLSNAAAAENELGRGASWKNILGVFSRYKSSEEYTIDGRTI